MIQDFEKRLNDKMEHASLKELMPGFDSEQEWLQLSQNLLPVKRRLLFPVWSYAAAILVLFSVVGLTWYLSATHTQQLAAHGSLPSGNKANTVIANDTNAPGRALAIDTLQPAIAVIKVQAVQHKENNKARKYAANGIIHNGTPCPIELRISQVMSCPDNQPRAISSSSTLEPDQSGQLNYKENKTLARNCSLTIKEIEIKSIATGEIILLNSSSSPSTAQDVFSYITREKKGDILAGMFNYDCDKKTRKHSLRLNNRDGGLSIE